MTTEQILKIVSASLCFSEHTEALTKENLINYIKELEVYLNAVQDMQQKL